MCTQSSVEDAKSGTPVELCMFFMGGIVETFCGESLLDKPVAMGSKTLSKCDYWTCVTSRRLPRLLAVMMTSPKPQHGKR